jgi:hypothetical protein
VRLRGDRAANSKAKTRLRFDLKQSRFYRAGAVDLLSYGERFVKRRGLFFISVTKPPPRFLVA